LGKTDGARTRRWGQIQGTRGATSSPWPSKSEKEGRPIDRAEGVSGKGEGTMVKEKRRFGAAKGDTVSKRISSRRTAEQKPMLKRIQKIIKTGPKDRGDG